MKRALLLFITLTLELICYAQPQNIIDSGDVWQEAKYYFFPEGSYRSDFYYRAGSDTTIEGVTWKKLFIVDDERNYQNPTFNWSWRGYIRQDTVLRKTYRKFFGPNNESLWYDFNYTKGDSLDIYPEMYPPGSKYYVAKDTIIKQFEASLHMLKIDIDGSSSWNYCGEPHYLIDGIGSTEGFSTPLTHFEDPLGCLACYLKDGELIYSGDVSYQFCDKTTGINEAHKQKDSTQLLIYPNPINNNQNNLSIIGEFPKQVSIEIFDFQLRKIFSGTIEGVNPELEIPKLPSGNYTLLITGTNKVARFVKM